MGSFSHFHVKTEENLRCIDSYAPYKIFQDSIRKNNWEWASGDVGATHKCSLAMNSGQSHLTKRPGGHLRMVLASVGPWWRLSRPPEDILRLLVLALQFQILQADKQSCNIIGCPSGWYSWVCRGWGLIESRQWLWVYSICWLILLRLH